jgi:signal transduction histidine kinase
VRDKFLWRLLAAQLLVIAIAVAISDAMITHLATQSFMQIMERYHIDPTSVERDFLATVHHVLLVSSIAAGAAAMLLGWVLVRRLVRPIGEMMVLSERIAAGDYGRRIVPRGPDELVRLAESLNRMAASLQRVEALRRDLVANIAHELRTPLSTLQGYLEALRDGVAPVTSDTLASLHDEAIRLVRLVNALQQLSQFDARLSEVRRDGVDLAALAHGVVRAYAPEFERLGFVVDERYEPAEQPARVDADLIGQALRVLLDNVLRYAPDGTAVTVRLNRVDGALRVAVENTGGGIDAGDLPHIFERFYRGEKSRSRDTGGAGIGLSLVREIARAHGGETGAASAAGLTTVWFTVAAG